MNKWIVAVLLFVIGLSNVQAAPLPTAVERDLREKLKTGLLKATKDNKNYPIHLEDLPDLKFEYVSIKPLILPTEKEWKAEPQTVDYLLQKSAKKAEPQDCIFVRKDGKVVGFLTSLKNPYMDQKIGAEIQKIYDAVKDPSRIVWIYFDSGKLGKWLTFNVKNFAGENLTLVDYSGETPPGYYFDLLSLKKVIERAYDM